MRFRQKLLIAGWLILAPFTTTACQNSPSESISTTPEPSQTIANTSQPSQTIVNTPITSQPKDYIGFQYENPEQIKDLEFLGGMVFLGGAVKNMQGGYAYMRQNGQNMLWLIGQKKPDSAGKIISEVLDILTFTEYDKELNNRTYHLSMGRCRLNGKSNSDVEVVAIVVLEPKEWLDKVKQAWRINRKTGNFEPTTNDNMICENPNIS
ncbi:MAG TPA: hypothetical protein DEG17_11075 [Cyanobacteria bacterium UBA11149]|nr:hypothetical protein [Cyanobacteria bacterium UBA11367]HBE57591.1 hypothetical protein [Cyanobacteria bacterium UBA11366]HBK62541.1 hypothetical protein [Cyanobacteria bacterium UBA11166]HBR77057.1 hypothetical protein [Cyanobacteria bacterium UBA11159]HBS72000.1 hypothetical protein [Cyanobacteria bacterium UBA11153]HBW89391.1 hypothetical protein [Cyanobacteria bacterium UBA11149]HCA97338.1 hypothetical protein [Cyanobacteria bacterium UBA9226]